MWWRQPIMLYLLFVFVVSRVNWADAREAIITLTSIAYGLDVRGASHLFTLPLRRWKARIKYTFISTHLYRCDKFPFPSLAIVDLDVTVPPKPHGPVEDIAIVGVEVEGRIWLAAQGAQVTATGRGAKACKPKEDSPSQVSAFLKLSGLKKKFNDFLIDNVPFVGFSSSFNFAAKKNLLKKLCYN